MAEDFRRDNDRSRDRLRALIASAASADDATRATTSGMLCHLAFWDSYYAERWRLRLKGDRAAHVALGSQVHSINDAAARAWSKVTFDDAAQLAIEAAEVIDALVAGLSSDLIAEVRDAGNPRLLERYRHRHEHLDGIPSMS